MAGMARPGHHPSPPMSVCTSPEPACNRNLNCQLPDARLCTSSDVDRVCRLRQGILDRRLNKVSHQPKRHDRYQADKHDPAHAETPLVSCVA